MHILDGFLAPPLHIHNILKGFNYFLLRVRSDLEKSKNSKAFDPLLIVILIYELKVKISQAPTPYKYHRK